MNHAGTLTASSGLNRQHGATMALRNHGVLQMGRPAPDHLLQLVATPGAKLLPLATEALKQRTGAIRDAPPLFDREFETLLKLRECGHIHQQCRAVRAQVRIIDLTAQSPGRPQGLSHRQQFLTGRGATFAATQQDRG